MNAIEEEYWRDQRIIEAKHSEIYGKYEDVYLAQAEFAGWINENKDLFERSQENWRRAAEERDRIIDDEPFEPAENMGPDESEMMTIFNEQRKTENELKLKYPDVHDRQLARGSDEMRQNYKKFEEKLSILNERLTKKYLKERIQQVRSQGPLDKINKLK